MGQLPQPDSGTFRIVIRWMVGGGVSQASPIQDYSVIWSRVQTIFSAYCAGSGSIFTAASAYFLYEPLQASTLQPWEPVVYVVDSWRRSQIAARLGQPADSSATGRTAVGGPLNLSEVYFDHPYHDDPATLANTIVHELMHNKLNMDDSMHSLAPFVGDIGGFLQETLPHTLGLSPTGTDIATLAPALSSVEPQLIGP